MIRVAITLGLALAFASGCAIERDGGDWIREIGDAHLELDRAGDRAARIDAMYKLDALVEQEPPADVARSDARTVRQDAYYVLASTALADGDPYAARRFATIGLSLGVRRDVLVTNLLVARGEALELLGEPARAASDYHRALTIASEMLDARLGGVGGSSP